MKLTHTRPRAQPNAITIAGAGDVRAAPAALTGVACVLKDARSLPNRPPPAPLVEEKKMRRVLGSGKGGEGEATQKSARPGATYFSAGSVSRARERRACRKVKKKKGQQTRTPPDCKETLPATGPARTCKLGGALRGSRGFRLRLGLGGGFNPLLPPIDIANGDGR